MLIIASVWTIDMEFTILSRQIKKKQGFWKQTDYLDAFVNE